MTSSTGSGGSMLAQAVWPGIVIEEWRAFVMNAAQLIDEIRAGRLLLFRGQPNQWKLRPSLLRSLPPGVSRAEAEQAEKRSLDHFRSQVHLYYPVRDFPFAGIAPILMDWWALMQHHNAPTRLLDWSASPYVGAYFAAESEPDHDGVILVIDGDSVTAAYKRDHPDPEWPPELQGDESSANLRVFTPFYKTMRLAMHQGYFTVALNPLDVHDDLLVRAGAIRARWVIKAKFKSEMLHQLRIMNVAAHTLFPGLDGLGRSAGELIRAPSIRPLASPS